MGAQARGAGSLSVLLSFSNAGGTISEIRSVLHSTNAPFSYYPSYN